MLIIACLLIEYMHINGRMCRPLFFLLCLPLRLYVIWPALQPRGAYPIRLAVLQCVPTDLMRSEWLTGLSLLPAVFSPPCSAHTCAQEAHNLMRADCCFHLPQKEANIISRRVCVWHFGVTCNRHSALISSAISGLTIYFKGLVW